VSPKAQRIAIAQTCGYVPHTPGAHGVLRWTHPDFGSEILYVDDLPDYLNDLNAMSEAEEVLYPRHSHPYEDTLYELVACASANKSEWRYLTAEAGQRAEAFLKTLNKWEDSK
jgi:hypothetical protein